MIKITKVDKTRIDLEEKEVKISLHYINGERESVTLSTDSGGYYLHLRPKEFSAMRRLFYKTNEL